MEDQNDDNNKAIVMECEPITNHEANHEIKANGAVTKQALENLLRKMPIWTRLDALLVECRDVKQQMRDFSRRSMETKAQIDQLPMLTAFSRLDINDEIEVRENKAIVSLPAHCSYVEDVATKQLHRVRLEDDICITPEKIREKEIKMNQIKKTISLTYLEEKLLVGDTVYVCVKENKPWVLADITLIYPHNDQVNIKVQTKTEEKRSITVNKFRIARIQKHSDLLCPGKRVIAGITPGTMMPGIIGESPHHRNDDRYLVLFDNGTARYHKVDEVLPIIAQSRSPWNDVITKDNSKIVSAHMRDFFARWPSRNFRIAEPGQTIAVTYNNQVVEASVLEVDRSVIRLLYPDNREETIPRISPRFLYKEDRISQLLKDEVDNTNFHPTLRQYLDLYAEASHIALDEKPLIISRFIEDRHGHGICKRNVAKKSTSRSDKGRSSPTIHVEMAGAQVEDLEDLEDYTGDEAETHRKCTPACLEASGECPNLDDKYRNESVLKIPLLIGWKRVIRNVPTKNKTKNRLQVMYESPCKRTFRLPMQIFRYIKDTGSLLDIDYFTFDLDVRFNAKHLDTTAKAKYYEEDLSMAKVGNKWQALEKKPISIINTINQERLPEDFEYRSTRFFHPNLEKKGFTFNEEFRSCCDCEDDCSIRTSCACQNLTEDSYHKPGAKRGQFVDAIQYKFKRLVSNVQTGIFECNPDCKCSSKCPNRVVQNGLKFRLQVFKTIDKGWGVRTLDDIPKGSFISTYSAEVLDDADQYGDSDVYFADLDYVSVNENKKEGYESGVDDPDDDDSSSNNDAANEASSQSKKKNQPKAIKNEIDPSDSDVSEISELNENDINSQDSFKPSQDTTSSSSEEDEFYDAEEGHRQDYDYVPQKKKNKKRSLPRKSRYPKRNRTVVVKPSLIFEKPPKPKEEPRVEFKRIRRILGNKNNYTLDARMQGNVGRFFNHCCDPNTFVQNVFIDTHDLRFPVVSFFASTKIDAMAEITWNYSYKLGSIPGREMKCYCGTMSCKGRIL